jgi:hypothetical protein
MSVLTDRAAVAYKFALRELEPDFREWLAAHPAAVDVDGNQVICVFAPDELAQRMMSEVLAYRHPIILASEVDGHIVAGQIGPGTTAPADRPAVHVDTQTVADILRIFGAAQNDGGVVLEFSLVGDQALVLV